MRGCFGLIVLSAKIQLKESVKMTCLSASLTSIKQRAFMIATSSALKTDAWSGREKERVSGPATNAHPTPSAVLDPSVKNESTVLVGTHMLYR